MSFSGWPDAGKVIQSTLDEIRGTLHFEPAASMDMDGFWNVQTSRPQVDVRHGQVRKIEWPSYDFSLWNHPGYEPLVLGRGPEPVGNWKSFSRQILRLLKKWGCAEIALLGCIYDQITHEEVVVSSVVQDSGTYNRLSDLGCGPIEYKGPGAVHSAIMEEAKQAGIPCFCIWAHFPFYLRGPHEMLMARLLGILGPIMGLHFETARLVALWEKREKEIEELIEQDQELRKVVDNLKKQPEEEHPAPSTKIVRLEEFLKKRHEPHDK